MKNKIHFLVVLILLPILVCSFIGFHFADKDFITYTVDPKNQDLKMYLKNEKGEVFKSFENLRIWLEKRNNKLVFAMNGGMFTPEMLPQGLYIENFKTIKKLDIDSGYGNFYMKPNGVFLITASRKAHVCKSEDFYSYKDVKYATQSGPMLVIGGKLNPKFIEGSKSLFVRNGVGVMPDGKLLFAISKKEINFYDFASFFKRKGCKNALYLDGFVSRIYISGEKEQDSDGEFGVIIGLSRPK